MFCMFHHNANFTISTSNTHSVLVADPTSVFESMSNDAIVEQFITCLQLNAMYTII